MKMQQVNLTAVRQAVAKQLNMDAQEIQDDDDLFMLGLDSVSLMTLVGFWRDAGINIEFQDLVETPTVQDWLQRLRQ